jgi:hypothetical protein
MKAKLSKSDIFHLPANQMSPLRIALISEEAMTCKYATPTAWLKSCAQTASNAGANIEFFTAA